MDKLNTKYNKAVAAILSPIFVWLLARYGIEFPPDAQVAIGSLLIGLAVYLVPNKDDGKSPS